MLGETPAFVQNPYRFLEDRRRRYGDVFTSNVAGHKVVFLSGRQGAEAFYDAENVTRSEAHPFLMVDMFGGTNFEMYDGPRHLALKTVALDAFDRAAMARYLPDMQRLIESTLERLARLGSFSATAELRRLAVEAICLNVMGLSPGVETTAMAKDYGTMLAGLASRVPVRIPGTPYGRAMAGRDRLLARIRAIVEARRVTPGSDGLSRMLGTSGPDGRTYTDDEAILEIHHVVVAGFVVYSLMGEVLRHLAQQQRVRDRCREEVEKCAPSGSISIDSMKHLQLSTQVVLEAKRWTPLVPLAFGRARRAFDCGGHPVPQGWRVYLALHLINRDPEVYANPEAFDPDRFGPGRAEHMAHLLAFIPQGAGPPTGHQCLGLDYSTFLVLAFLALLVRGYDWDLPSQDLRFDWTKRPPEPRDGLRVELRAR